jgi:hypothetical protein
LSEIGRHEAKKLPALTAEGTEEMQERLARKRWRSRSEYGMRRLDAAFDGSA